MGFSKNKFQWRVDKHDTYSSEFNQNKTLISPRWFGLQLNNALSKLTLISKRGYTLSVRLRFCILIFSFARMASAVKTRLLWVTLSFFHLKEPFRRLKPDIYATFDKDSWPVTDASPLGYLGSDDTSGVPGASFTPSKSWQILSNGCHASSQAF